MIEQNPLDLLQVLKLNLVGISIKSPICGRFSDELSFNPQRSSPAAEVPRFGWESSSAAVPAAVKEFQYRKLGESIAERSFGQANGAPEKDGVAGWMGPKAFGRIRHSSRPLRAVWAAWLLSVQTWQEEIRRKSVQICSGIPRSGFEGGPALALSVQSAWRWVYLREYLPLCSRGGQWGSSLVPAQGSVANQCVQIAPCWLGCLFDPPTGAIAKLATAELIAYAAVLRQLVHLPTRLVLVHHTAEAL